MRQVEGDFLRVGTGLEGDVRRLLIHVYIFLFTVAFVIIGVFAYDLEPIPNPFYRPVAAAPVAPPEVKECELVNTAAVSDKIIIAVLRCQPENGAPYLINSAGFMMPEE